MKGIHPTAVVHPGAKLGNGVSAGPYAVIEEGVTIGDGCAIHAHAQVLRGTSMGRDNVVHAGAVIGDLAQHRAAEPEESFVRIGDGNVFREYVTVHRSYLKGGSTLIGNNNFFMAFSHVGHDGIVGNGVTVANASLLGGHVILEDSCTVSAGVALHQNCRVGRLAMIGGMTSVTKDVPPFMLVDNGTESVGSLNVIGLKRGAIPPAGVKDIKHAYRLLYLNGLLLRDALEAIDRDCKTPEARHLLDFVRASKRGILPHRRSHGASEDRPTALSA